MEHGKGTLWLRDDVLDVRLAAYSGNQLVSVEARVEHPASGPVGWVEAKGEDIPVDERLLERPARAAPRGRPLAGPSRHDQLPLSSRALTPAEPWHQDLQIVANRCWIRHEKFPYSLANIHGTLAMSDGNWTFQGLEGTNGATRVICEGTLTRRPKGTIWRCGSTPATFPWKTNFAMPWPLPCGRSGAI